MPELLSGQIERNQFCTPKNYICTRSIVQNGQLHPVTGISFVTPLTIVSEGIAWALMLLSMLTC